MLAETFGGIWRAHPLCPSYWFSKDGRIARLVGDKAKLLNGTRCGQGRYRGIDMHSGEKRIRVYVHVTVCELFNGPAPRPGLHCRHLDTNKENNSAENLAWGTPLENSADSVRHGKVLCGERNPMAKLTRTQVAEMRAIREQTCMPFHAIAKQFGVTTMTAHRAITGALWR